MFEIIQIAKITVHRKVIMEMAGASQELGKIHQEHLLKWVHELTEPQRASLLEQVEKLDFKNIPLWVEQYVKGEGTLKIPDKFEPAPAYPAAANGRIDGEV
jgi:hypothetical protein